MALDLYDMLVFAKMNNFHVAYYFVRNGEDTRIFGSGEAHDSTRVVAGDERV